ncbi:MAG TPA: MFS transporter [Pirellulales bacterium]|jgi:MFS family permease|nr:MFS transporter [Pirellulales bacterium]
MTTIAAPADAVPKPASVPLERRHWLAAMAMLFVLFAPYQTLVQTVITDDAVRKGVEVDDYDMTWVQVAYGIGVLYGVFSGLWLSGRLGARDTITIGLVGFAVGNLLCGAATGLASLALGRFVDGFGKLLVMVLGRATLYKQFDRLLLVAIGFYGVFAYATRYWTPLLMAELNVHLSWRWMYWAYVPVALVALTLVRLYFRADRPPKPVRLPIDWLAVTLFVACVVAIVFAFGWYRKWGGWTSNAFALTVILCLSLPMVLVGWVASGHSPDEHLQRLLRTRVYVLAMATRGLMLLHLVAVLTIVGLYATELRGYPRTTAGWLMVPTSLTMASATLLTTCFQRRSLRHVWLVVGFVGSAVCVWWLSSLDNFTPKEHIAVMLACWGAFVGLIPPVFLTDEVEGLNPKDGLYAGALGIVALVVPIITVPTATGTVIKAWSDRALDTYRLNLSTHRPAVPDAAARVAGYYEQRGLSGPALQQETGRVLGTFATVESIAFGFRSGLRALSLSTLALGLAIALPLWRAARGLRAPPGAGYE